MQLVIDQSKKEVKLHGSEIFPVLISPERLSRYERGQFLAHWHPEIELTYIQEGEILYTVHDREYHLEAGDAVFCNANAVHSGKMSRQQDCRYVSITFLPKIIYGFEYSKVKHKYVDEVIRNPFLSAVVFKKSEAKNQEVLQHFWQLALLAKEQDKNELEIVLLLLSIWLRLHQELDQWKDKSFKIPTRETDYERLREMLTYLHDHYAEKIRLSDITKAVNLCESECCCLFKKYMNTTIVNYLTNYRIEKSLYYLDYSDLGITEISYKVGFSAPSYYSNVFKKYKGYAPAWYRNRQRE